MEAPTTTSGAVSPITRDIDKIVPVKMPGMALGKTWFQIVCHFVAPIPRLASRNEGGTAFIASCAAMMIIGKPNNPSVRPADKTVRPLAVVPASTYPNAAPLVIGSRKRTNTANPNIP